MSDILLIKNPEEFKESLENEGLVPSDQFMSVNEEQRIAIGLHSSPDDNDEHVEPCNVVGSMHVVNDYYDRACFELTNERVEWHVGCEDMDPNEDASQWA